jgi:hypothetical protein
MKILSCAALALLAAGMLSGCGGASQSAPPAPVASTPPPPAAVTGVDTPKSVSVVTAN